MEPKVGEWWFVTSSYSNKVYLQKVLAITDTHIISKTCPYYEAYYEPKSRFIAKWEPNYFYKLLGYK